MKNKPLKIVLALFCTSSIALTTSASWANTPDENGPTTKPGTKSSVAFAPISGSIFSSTKGRTEPNSAGPRLLGYFDWLQCWNYANDTWAISSFKTTYLGVAKTMSIQCGSARTHGYLHIVLGDSNHENGWRNRIAQANPGDNTDSWDDLMWWSAQQAWMRPDVSVNVGNGKVCRSAPIAMFGRNPNGSQYVKYTFRPTFIWSITDNRLITAIPSTSASC